MTEPSTNPAVLIAEGMARFREEMEANDRVSLAISRKTKSIMKWVGLSLAAMTATVVFHIWTMRTDLMAMVRILENMYQSFDAISSHLDVMTGQMKTIQARVADLPSVAGDMTAINLDVKDLRWAMGTMNSNVSAMTLDMARLRDTTGEMSRHFFDVQQTVGGLNYNIEQMLRPMSMVPR
jgi:hypothetical protein